MRCIRKTRMFSSFLAALEIKLLFLNMCNSVHFKCQCIFDAFNPQTLHHFINFYNFRSCWCFKNTLLK